jgi:hypothetical protein
VARRWHVTHTLRVKLKPGDFNATIARGDIVQLQFTRWASVAAPAVHSYFYEVEQVGRARTGEVSLELTHFPVDEEGRSLVALDVMSAEASGIMLPTAKIASVTCDTNSSTDQNVPDDVSLDPINWADTPYADAFDPVDNGTGSGGSATGSGGLRRGTWGGRGAGGGGGGGGDEGGDRTPDTPPPPGTPPAPYSPPDAQTPPPDVTVPPANVPPGGSAPADWVNEYNRQVANSGDTPFPTDWSDWPSASWSLVYAEDFFEQSSYRGSGFSTTGAGSVTIAAPGGGGLITPLKGYITDVGGVVTVYSARVVVGDLLDGGIPYYPLGQVIHTRTDTNDPWWRGWRIYPTAPTIRLVSATRNA